MTEFAELKTDGRVATPGDADWDEVRLCWNLAADLKPAAVVFAANAADVAATVAFAAANDLRVDRPGDRPRRRRPRRPRRHDPDQDRGHARDRGRRRRAERAGRGRRAQPRAGRGRQRARPLLAARLLARRGRDRLHARRRHELAQPQARVRLQPGDGDRAGQRRRRGAHGRRRERARPVLGPARRRRWLRDRHRASGRPAADRRDLRGRPALPRRGRRRRRADLPRLGRQRARTRSPRWSAS